LILAVFGGVFVQHGLFPKSGTGVASTIISIIPVGASIWIILSLASKEYYSNPAMTTFGVIILVMIPSAIAILLAISAIWKKHDESAFVRTSLIAGIITFVLILPVALYLDSKLPQYQGWFW
jgi:hypothetical protein